MRKKKSIMKLYCQIYSSGYLEELYQPPIIFLHGMAFNGKIYQKVGPIIAKRTKRKVYVPDLRNHGNSPWSKEMNYNVLTDDVLELMEQYKIPKAILIGSSMGGRIVMNLALNYPHKTDAIVVEDMTPRNIVSSGTNLVTTLHKFVQEILNSFSTDLDIKEIKKNIAEVFVDFQPELVNKEKFVANYDPDFVPIVKDGDHIRLECNADVVSTMVYGDSLVQDLPDQNSIFEGPALFLYGSRGFFNLDKDPSIKKVFPKAIIKRIEDASHFTYFDSPEQYTSLVTDFILNKNVPQSKY